MDPGDGDFCQLQPGSTPSSVRMLRQLPVPPISPSNSPHLEQSPGEHSINRNSEHICGDVRCTGSVRKCWLLMIRQQKHPALSKSWYDSDPWGWKMKWTQIPSIFSFSAQMNSQVTCPEILQLRRRKQTGRLVYLSLPPTPGLAFLHLQDNLQIPQGRVHTAPQAARCSSPLPHGPRLQVSVRTPLQEAL